MRGRERRRRLGGAFTLVEMLTVLVIMGIVLAIALPAVERFTAARQAEAAARKVNRTLMLARLEALSMRRLVAVLLPEVGRGTEIATAYVVRAGNDCQFQETIPGAGVTKLGAVGIVSDLRLEDGTAPSLQVHGVEWAWYGKGTTKYAADCAAIVFRPTGALVREQAVIVSIADAARTGENIVVRSPRVLRLRVDCWSGRVEWLNE